MKQLTVIGGGAAGIFCAVNAARLHPQLNVVVLEKSARLLSKVKVSGGGRCNVTHADFEIESMSRQYPRGRNFVKKTFHQFFTTDTIQWFEERGVKIKKEEDGRMFPITNSSQTIIDCLLKEATKYKVDIRLHSELKSFEVQQSAFKLQLANGESITSDFLCIACGGYPKFPMFEWITSIGHSIEGPVPSLFTFNLAQNDLSGLMGISVPNAKVKILGSKLEESGPVLVTHWGLSGPAVLRLSAWGATLLAEKNYEFDIQVNWLPEFNEQTLRDELIESRQIHASQRTGSKNQFGLPLRLWEYFLDAAGINKDIRWADLDSKRMNQLIRILTHSIYAVKGKTTFKEEFVTAGGIKLNEIDPNTMQSKLIPRLYFAGEIIDVDGITGGYNFQHAWTSGFIAAKLLGAYPAVA